jgi:hypothetical protein
MLTSNSRTKCSVYATIYAQILGSDDRAIGRIRKWSFGLAFAILFTGVFVCNSFPPAISILTGKEGI